MMSAQLLTEQPRLSVNPAPDGTDTRSHHFRKMNEFRKPFIHRKERIFHYSTFFRWRKSELQMKRTIFQIKSFSLSVPLTLDSFISSNKLCKAKLFRDGFVLIFGENRNELPRSVVFVSSQKETSPQPPRRFPSGLFRVQRRGIESIEKSGLEIVFPSVFGFMLLRGRNWKIYYREKGRNGEDEENSFLVFLAISLFRSIFTHKPAFEI